MANSFKAASCRPSVWIFLAPLFLLVGAGGGLAAPFAPPGQIVDAGAPGLIQGRVPDVAKAAGDSLLLIGSWETTAPYKGGFEDISGQPDWNGWTHHDYIAESSGHWQASDYQAEGLAGHGPGNLAAWCGEDFPACAPEDPPGGYGNDYDEYLIWTAAVADPNQPCTVTVSGFLNHDLEIGYDYLYLAVATASDPLVELLTYDGTAWNVPFNASFTYHKGDYLGDGTDQVKIMLVVKSDSSWSDEDCLGYFAGACQIDDISVGADNGVAGTFDDFQAGTLGNWAHEAALGVGDFAKIWSGLEDNDPCGFYQGGLNYTPQVAFIDDGEVVPGTGGTLCDTWCYGPSGYIVNNTGGLLGPGHYLHNGIESPVIPWPGAPYDGGVLELTAYLHETLGYPMPGMMVYWAIRSTAAADPAQIDGEPWLNNDFLYAGGPAYERIGADISEHIVPDCTFVQVKVAVMQAHWIWPWDPFDGTPAPYFDDVRLVAYESAGPFMEAASCQLAQDSFPASGNLDLGTLGSNSVRFDMAQNIAPASSSRNDAGDSLVINAFVRRPGAALTGSPLMHYKVHRNAVFDAFRTAGLPDEGDVAGLPVVSGGVPSSSRFSFDLPDTGFLFPGDILHYYFAATEDLGGDVRTALLPGDITGFGDFSGALTYDPRFTMRALPTVIDAGVESGPFMVPQVLFWYDQPDDDGFEKWLTVMSDLGLQLGREFDLYRTQAGNRGVGQGLGGRATVDQIAGYEDILYDSGREPVLTLGWGDFDTDPSADIPLLTAWLELGGRDLLLMGDGLASSLTQSAPGAAFLADWMAQTVSGDQIQGFIGNQDAPQVGPIFGNGVFQSLSNWVVLGSCPDPRRIDAVVALAAPDRIAEFLDPMGESGAYPYAAAVRHADPVTLSRTVSFPYSLGAIEGVPVGVPDAAAKALKFFEARALVLMDVLVYLGVDFTPPPPALVPEAGVFSAGCHPNPFNPRVLIDFNLPQATAVTVKIFDLKGQLVRSLLAGRREAGPGTVVWEGTDGAGSPVASGVYFYEVRAGSQEKIGKMMLVR